MQIDLLIHSVAQFLILASDGPKQGAAMGDLDIVAGGLQDPAAVCALLDEIAKVHYNDTRLLITKGMSAQCLRT